MADVIRSRLAEVEAEIARLEQESAEHSRLGSEKAREAEELRRLAGSLVAGRDNRAAIAYHLASGAKTAKELASLAQLSASTVATHLTALRMAGKVCQSYNGAGRQAYRLIDPSAPPSCLATGYDGWLPCGKPATLGPVSQAEPDQRPYCEEHRAIHPLEHGNRRSAHKPLKVQP